MPTPSKLSIHPGTLCWLRRPANKQNVGKVVEVQRLSLLTTTETVFWVVKANTPILVSVVGMDRFVEWPAGREIQAQESWLIPIAGPGLVDEVAAYDKAVGQETLGQLLRDYGMSVKPARSTPHTRR